MAIFDNLFDTFKSDESKQREEQEQQEINYIRARKEVEHNVFDALMREFKVAESVGLRQAASSQDPPTAILRHENQAFSLWHRVPIRGESRCSHIVDFAIYRGTHRIANKANPDFVIECRQLEASHSNRIDTRIVNDLVGLSVDLLPGIAILATSRELAESAKALASNHGIQLINMQNEASGRELLGLITCDRQTTRERLMKNLEQILEKLDSIIVRRLATPWGRKILEEKHERLKDRVLKELSNGKKTASQLARLLHTHQEFVLNELYALERENKARIIERSVSSEEENIWAMNPALKK